MPAEFDALEFHGVTVPDPERWLASLEDPAARQWLAAQDAAASEFLERHTRIRYCREFMRRNFILVDPPWEAVRGERTYFLARRGAAGQLTIALRRATGEECVLVDPHESGKVLDGDSVTVSPSGRYIAYGLSCPGEVLVTPQVYDVDRATVAECALLSTVTPMIAWHPGEAGYYYSLCRGLFHPQDRGRDGIYWHALGTDGRDDVCVKPYADGRGHLAFARIADGGAYLIIFTLQFSSGLSGVGLCPIDRTWPAAPRPAASTAIFEEMESINHFIGEVRGRLYFHTTLDAPMGRIVAIDPARPARSAWTTVVAESACSIARPDHFPGPLKSAITPQALLLTYVEHAHDVLMHFDTAGTLQRKVDLPVASTVDAIVSRGDEFRVYSQSFLVPRQIFHYHAAPRAPAVLVPVGRLALPDIAAEDYEVQQVFCPVRGDVAVPIYLVHRRGIRRDGEHATLLYAYGGFGQSIAPEYMPDIALWLKLGGVFALANIRGGGEYGESWHAAGSRENKQTSFDDFYAAAQYLIDQGLTRPERLAIKGISNGGLLTAVCANQRPDLFAAIVSEVPLTDVLSLGQSATGRAVTAEYGSPEDSRGMFEVLRSYSPLHNVPAHDSGVPQWVVAAEKDGSAPAAQACRFVAARQSNLRRAGREGAVFLRFLRGEGHTGWPGHVACEVIAEEMAFLHHFTAAS